MFKRRLDGNRRGYRDGRVICSSLVVNSTQAFCTPSHRRYNYCILRGKSEDLSREGVRLHGCDRANLSSSSAIVDVILGKEGVGVGGESGGES